MVRTVPPPFLGSHVTSPSRSSALDSATYDRRHTPAIAGPRQPRRLTLPHASAPAPATVSPDSWGQLIFQVDVARRGGPFTGGALRHAVRAVVGEMRAASDTCDAVYTALGSSVGEETEKAARQSADHGTHSSRSAALIAHMHSWADCVRLDELERLGE